ncbi:MAG TPA: hypothetical protein VGH03_04645 [Caulobacteraceae bacterium]
MIRKLSIACAIAAAVSLGAASASAQAVSQKPYTKADLKDWSGDQSTLAHMIQRIESTTGGRVIEIRFTSSDGAPGFRTVLAKGGKVTFIHAAAQNGQTVEMSTSTVPDWMLKWRARADVGQALQATIPLTQAIRTAEQQGEGPAVAAGIASSAANATSDVQAYNVLIYRDGDVRRVSVDIRSGQIIQNPRALADWP